MNVAAQKKILSFPHSSSNEQMHLESSTARKISSSRASYLFDFLILLPVIIFICFTYLGIHPVRHIDEITHIRVVQEMKLNGSWWSPTVFGKPYFHKPPFKMWLSLIFVTLFGESNFTYRFLDALAGAGTVYLTYILGRRLFQSRSVGLFSALLLLGCRAYILDHGVRHAVQDSVLVFLTTLTLYGAWNFLEALAKAPKQTADQGVSWFGSQESRYWMFFGGITIGLAALTKNVAGYVPMLILGIYLIANGQIKLVWQRARYAPLVILGLGLLFPTAYLLPHCLYDKVACIIMLDHEVYSRATVGYHNQSRIWFYIGRIFRDRLAVPPELLTVGLLFVLYKIVWPYCSPKKIRQPALTDQNQTQRNCYLFIFLWAVVPVLFFSLIPSRLVWYIASAHPGMCLVVGAMLGSLSSHLWSRVWQKSGTFRVREAASLLLLLYSAGAITTNLGIIGNQILTPKEPILMETLTNDILNYSMRRPFAGSLLQRLFPSASDITPMNAQPHVTHFQMPILSRNESLYFGRIAPFSNEVSTLEDLRATLHDKTSPQFVFTLASNFSSVVKLRPIAGYRFLPPPTVFQLHPRTNWVVMLSYQKGPGFEHLMPVEKVVRFSELSDDSLLYGWSSRIMSGEEKILKSRGDKSAVIVKGDGAFIYLGTKISLNAFRLGSAPYDGDLGIQVFLNDEQVGELPSIGEESKTSDFMIPPGKWQSGKNVFHFVSQYRDGRTIDRASEQIAWRWMKVELNQ